MADRLGSFEHSLGPEKIHAMRHVLMSVVWLVLLTTTAGCWHCRHGAPVDFESVSSLVHSLTPAAAHYPYSCPRCPYFDRRHCVWHSPCPSEPEMHIVVPQSAAAVEPQPAEVIDSPQPEAASPGGASPARSSLRRPANPLRTGAWSGHGRGERW